MRGESKTDFAMKRSKRGLWNVFGDVDLKTENMRIWIKMIFDGIIIILQLCYPPANGANERSEICVVSRGGNFFN